MNGKVLYRLSAITFATVLTGMSASPAAGTAQSVTGQARAVQVTALTTTVLADTGTLGSAGDARDATLTIGSVPSVLRGETLRAVTVGWPDQVASEASLADLRLTVGGTGVSADFVMARALAVLGESGTASSLIGNLAINGVAVPVTGAPNQRIPIPGGQLVLNEQRTSSAGTVNAIHATVFGVADVVVASATAGIQ
jgi:hypothetical protein